MACLAGTGTALAQAAAEAAAAGAAASSAGRGSGAAGRSLGSVLARTGAKVEASTRTAIPTASTRTQGASSGSATVTPAGIITTNGSGGQSGAFTVVGPPPQIHFDAVSFKRCAVTGSGDVDLPAGGDSVAFHCQPVSRIIDFAYAGAPAATLNRSGYPSWAETDLYDFQAEVAGEDLSTWQRMDLNARRIAVRRLLAEELKLRTHVDRPQPGNAQVDAIVVDHIERPAAD
jgi:hypothetical protein